MSSAENTHSAVSATTEALINEKKRKRSSSSDEGILEQSTREEPEVNIDTKEQHQAKRPGKKCRGNRGALESLLDMPMDVLHEIFGQLKPFDILNLSRTSKELRALLMNRTSSLIWQKARSNVVGMPDCPDDLSEPQYADVAFGKHCYYCTRNRNTNVICWSGRLRCCTKCLQEQFQPTNFSWRKTRPYGAELARLLPEQGGKLGYLHVLMSVDKTWVENWNSLPNDQARQAWAESKIKAQRKLWNHARECNAWMTTYESGRVEQEKRFLQTQLKVVMERLRKSGFEEELAVNKLEDLPWVEKACRKELTERVILNLLRYLEPLMQHAKERRLLHKRQQLLKERLPILNALHSSYVAELPFNAVYPSIAELYRTPLVEGLILNMPKSMKLTEGHLAPIKAALPYLVVEWRNEIDRKLMTWVHSGSDPDSIIVDGAVLALATTVFRCKGTSGHCPRFVRYPRVLMHYCVNNDMKSHGTRDFMQETTGSANWNSSDCLSFQSDDLKLLAAIVKCCGYDPKSTTAFEMDEANPILECIACHDDNKGRAVMPWSAMVKHQADEHKNADAWRFAVLHEPDATKARESIIEQEERYMYERNKQHGKLSCTHCKEQGCLKDMLWHVKKVHNGSKRDLIRPIDDEEYYTTPMVYLWPPRHPEELVGEPLVRET